MSTTAIRIDDTLKERVAAASERSGKSSHAFILDAIERTVDQDEFDAELRRTAALRWKHLATSGESVAWDAAKRYVEARVAGKPAKRPVSRKPSR